MTSPAASIFMAVEIVKVNNQGALDPNGEMRVPGMEIPGFRFLLAQERGVDNQILINTTGGLGDIICAEPAIRYAVTSFKHASVSIATAFPDLFRHLASDDVEIFDTHKAPAKTERYLVFDTLYTSQNLQWEFIAHMFTHVVDHASISMFRCQLPIAERSIRLVPNEDEVEYADSVEGDIVIHAGRTWPSRTIPGWFWNKVIDRIVERGLTPILIGKNGPKGKDERGYVSVKTRGCVDMRNEMTIMETVALLQKKSVLLTNDSSPIHMAASGDAWIGMLSTAKHPEYITHWRNGQFGWRVQNHALGGLYQGINMCPNSQNEIRLDLVDPRLLESWLPDPVKFADWGIEKCTSIPT